MLKCSTHDVGGVLIITLEEAAEVPEERRSANRQALYETVTNREDPRFAVDLGSLDYMSSADFGFLISLRRRVEVRKGRVILFDVNPFIKSMLETMKLLRLFTLADDLSEALSLLPPTTG